MLTNFSVAFYNLENLFDAENNEFTLNKDYTSASTLEWSQDRYSRKIENLSNVISKVGVKNSILPPILLGVSEVENETCLFDLINSKKLVPYSYGFVHYNSPDERGIDVAFLYQKKHFELIYSKTYTLFLTDDQMNREYTRDVLLVSGKLFQEQVYVIINHWPSRTKGISRSDDKRVKAAILVRKIIQEINREKENAKIMIMGDFNDEPDCNSIQKILMADDLFNPMGPLKQQGKGSVKYKGNWYMFDQIILSNSFLSNSLKMMSFKHADIFDAFFLQEKSGKRKGAPKRTYIGKWHLGGYSDHFPVYMILKLNNA